MPDGPGSCILTRSDENHEESLFEQLIDLGGSYLWSFLKPKLFLSEIKRRCRYGNPVKGDPVMGLTSRVAIEAITSGRLPSGDFPQMWTRLGDGVVLPCLRHRPFRHTIPYLNFCLSSWFRVFV